MSLVSTFPLPITVNTSIIMKIECIYIHNSVREVSNSHIKTLKSLAKFQCFPIQPNMTALVWLVTYCLNSPIMEATSSFSTAINYQKCSLVNVSTNTTLFGWYRLKPKLLLFSWNIFFWKQSNLTYFQVLLWSFWTPQRRWRFVWVSRFGWTVSSGAALFLWPAAGFTTKSR